MDNPNSISSFASKVIGSLPVVGFIARERTAKLKGATPIIPLEIRIENALEGIYLCCFGKDPIEEEDERLLNVRLKAAYPSVEQFEIQRIVKDKAHKVGEGSVREPKPLTKEVLALTYKKIQRRTAQTGKLYRELVLCMYLAGLIGTLVVIDYANEIEQRVLFFINSPLLEDLPILFKF